MNGISSILMENILMEMLILFRIFQANLIDLVLYIRLVSDFSSSQSKAQSLLIFTNSSCDGLILISYLVFVVKYPRSIPVETTVIQDNATSKKVEVLGWLCFYELSIYGKIWKSSLK